MRRPTYFFSLVALGIGADQLTKALVFANFTRPHSSWPLIPGWVHLTPAKNPGVAFSLLGTHPWIVQAFSFVAIGALTWIYFRSRRSAHTLMLVALGLILAGAAGNLADRLRLGYVRDFIDFVPPLPLVGHWAVFNVADMCITVGVFCYLLSELLGRRRHAAAEEQHA